MARAQCDAVQTMKVQLVVSGTCAPCDEAEKIWREIAAERDLEFTVVDLGRPEGRALGERLRLKTIPALVVDGKLVAIGVQSREEARAIAAAAPAR